MRQLSKHGAHELPFREAILAVLTIWIVTIIFAALPFTLSGCLEHTLDAWFETVSGLTTTGSSILYPKAFNYAGQEVPIHRVFIGFQRIEYVFYGTVFPVIDPITHKTLLTGIEALPKALLFWRSLLNWYGGLGIVLLFIALLPALGLRGKVMFRYESTGPSFQPLFPQARTTAIVLFEIYVVLTVLCILALMVTNPAMPFFDSITIAFSTLSTGGFSIKNASIAAYNCIPTEVVVMIFMVAGGLNFALYYDLMRGKFYKFFEPETVLYILLLVGISLLASWNIYGAQIVTLTDSPLAMQQYGFWDSVRFGFFQIISAMT
ncbi:MAG TPA: potassium transporter TrkG, partial [Chlamydiales bacterium]|nr:potassium transporter TrkG [Chlamydiales bacterium]